ncbi:MAG: DUF87 domain-containing protein [Candidatus Saccharibacteria bacterium]
MRNITQLDDRESIEFSLTAIPTQPIKSKMLRRHLLAGGQAPIAAKGVFGLAGKGLIATTSTMSFIFDMANVNQTKKSPTKPVKIVNPRVVMLLDKLYEPLFKVSLQARIKAASQKRATALAGDFESALNNFAAGMGHQQYSKHAQPRVDIYSASDLASFFHIDKSFIDSGIYNIDQLKSLPKPIGVSNREPGDVVVGFNNYQGIKTDLSLNRTDRHRHLYVSGATGSGKSTLLANLMLQDINSGRGLTLIDPHGDLAMTLLKYIPSYRLADVIYFDPSDPKSRISLNLLELKSKRSSDNYMAEADQVTEGVISLFRKVFNEDGGHRIEYILRNAIQTCLTIPGSTIFTIYRLLTDRNFRVTAISKLDDQDLINFWRNELGSAGEYQRVKMTAGVTAKIGRFLFSEPSKRVFGQSKSTLDIAKIMDEGKILICNFAKGNIGEDGTKLFSTALLTKLQLAALGRVNTDPADRLGHYLYVDEFQTYAPSVLIQILSEARKYGLYLNMAEQSPSQQDIQSTSTILANVGNLMCFRTASPKDEQLLMPNFKDFLSSSDLNNLPAYNFYLKTTTIQANSPTSGQTYPLPIVNNHFENNLSGSNRSGRYRGLIGPHPREHRAT